MHSNQNVSSKNLSFIQKPNKSFHPKTSQSNGSSSNSQN